MQEAFFPVCPVCKQPLQSVDRTLQCAAKHSFDLAREGYVNLLTHGHKKADTIGDSREMARARRAFLEKGYFRPLADALIELLRESGKEHPNVLDICCGEGYYAKQIKQAVPCNLLGFDLSREMVRLAAKQVPDALFFVANLASVPLPDRCVDFAIHLFAPFHEPSFARLLKEDGKLVTVVPGRRHLFALKEAVYDTPYENDEKLPQTTTLRLTETRKVSAEIFLDNAADIQALFSMTPYSHRTKKEDLLKLEQLETLRTEIAFVLGIYESQGN